MRKKEKQRTRLNFLSITRLLDCDLPHFLDILFSTLLGPRAEKNSLSVWGLTTYWYIAMCRKYGVGFSTHIINMDVVF